MASLFQRLFSGTRPRQALGRDRLRADSWPGVIYAVGDVHGCAAELDMLETAIVADSDGIAGDKWIVMLGDYVDRGPRSADVLDRLCRRPPPGFQRFALAGNHEVMMLEFLRDPEPQSSWLKFGGLETLASYGIDPTAFVRQGTKARRAILDSHIPAEHLELLQSLPITLALPGVTFVHAGMRPGIAPDAQSDDDLLWMREPFLSSDTAEFGLVVHGHTPGATPDIRPHRISIDTGAFATGILTAIRLCEGAPPAYLCTGNAPN
jgi:serine/threonine protein phosphatase 1